jgi:predicted HTH transcriptional regulator
MAAIPSSDLPGHRQLMERAQAALDRLQEFPSVDFKESAAWDALRWRIVRTALGMGNLRDGGIVIIGVREQGRTWGPTGISDADMATYDPDVVQDQVGRHVSPGVSLDLVLHTHQDKKRYLVIAVHEFADTPLVCKRDGGPGNRLEVTAGAVYVRPTTGRARTTKVTTAEEMHELLELAAEKRARRILEVSRRVGITPPTEPTAQQRFDEELSGL